MESFFPTETEQSHRPGWPTKVVAAVSDRAGNATGFASALVPVEDSDQWDTRLASQTRRAIPAAIR
jgi:hypothetical protein